MTNPSISRFRAIELIGRGVWLELLRRQDLYVCALLMGAFLLGILVVRVVGIDSPATGTFVYQLGLSLASIVSHVLLLVLAVRQMPFELENRTLYPLLARPVRRADVLCGKWLFVYSGGALVYLLFTAVIWLSMPKLEFYDTTLFLQMILFQILSLGLLAALCIGLSLLLPRALAMALAGVMYFGGALVRRTLTDIGEGMRWFAVYIPDFGMLDLTTRYTDGLHALPARDTGLLFIYALGFSLIFLFAGIVAFERKRL